MIRRYSFKLYPNAAQVDALSDQARMCAELWNALLEMRETHYRRAKQRGDKKTSLTAFDQGRDLTALRAALPEWAAQPRGTQERVAEMLDLAFKAFFRRAKEGAGASSGYPKFKRIRDRHGAIIADSVHLREPVKSSWSFAPSNSAIGRCPPGSKASFSDDGKSESYLISTGSKQAPAETPQMWGDDRKARGARIAARHAETPQMGGDDKSQSIANSWRLKMRGVPGIIKARGKFPLAPVAHKTADIRFERGSWWFSICVEMPARRQKGQQSLKVAFDLIDSFAVVKTADGGCPAGLSDPFSNGCKSESRENISAQRQGSCGTPSNEGEMQVTAGVTVTPLACGTPSNEGEMQVTAGVTVTPLACGTPSNEGEAQESRVNACEPLTCATPSNEVKTQALQSERDKRFKKFSYRWKKYTRRIAAIKAKDARRRHHALHIWSTNIARAASELEIIAPPKQALRSGRGDAARPGAQVETIAALNRHVLNMAPASAIQMLEYKCAEGDAPCAIVRRDDHEITVGGVLRAASVSVRKAKRALKKATP